MYAVCIVAVVNRPSWNRFVRWNGLQALLLDLLIVFPGLVLYFFPKIPFKVSADASASATSYAKHEVFGFTCINERIAIDTGMLIYLRRKSSRSSSR